MQMIDIAAKEFELLKEVVPHATRFGVLFTPTAPSHVPFLQTAEASGAKLHIALYKGPVSSGGDFDAAFAAMALERVDGVVVHGAALTASHGVRLAELALRHRLPTIGRLASICPKRIPSASDASWQPATHPVGQECSRPVN